jgi:hypothetical protein
MVGSEIGGNIKMSGRVVVGNEGVFDERTFF